MEKTLSQWNPKNFIPLKKGKKKVINNIFISLSKHINDPFWVEIFEACSVGKFPKKGFKFQEPKLIYEHKKYDEILINENSKMMSYQLIEFFKNTISITSPNEEIEYFYFVPCKIDSIKDFKNKNIRLCYLIKFIEEKYSNCKNKNEIIDKLILYENFKLIDNSNYIFENGDLIDIKGIEQVNNKLLFNIKIKKKSRTTRKQKQNNYINLYDKHFENLKKKNLKKQPINTDVTTIVSV